ncbi:hypothetical protein [Frankia sp. QA3]|uniref:hypothetical protein n=1 Tax=Frankia sp. QA3 TaxID=710111 RepID=UPI000269D020|nr:hypothetical protein [Frankia sp. QA3]EIV95979.1 hypothetical protein FraQA3DRAFT_5839 [Frankia sp. QA3]
MRAFDSDDYRRRVLAVVHRRGGAEHSDPFEIYDIPLAEVDTLDDAAIRARIAEVWAFWQRSRDHPRYRGVIIGLLDLHAELSEALADRTRRLALRDRVAAARATRDDERFAALDAAVARLVARFGGIPADRIAGLRAWAATQGIDESAFTLRTRRHRIVPASPAAGPPDRPRPEPIPVEVLRQIRADLDELGRITASAPPRSLFDLLGVPPGASREQIRELRDEALTRNRARRPDRRRALLDDLLAAVGALLVEGDPDAYLDALAAATSERLRPRVAAAVLVEDALLPAEAAELVAEAEADGLDSQRARAVVRSLARAQGVTAPPLPPPAAPHGFTRPPGAGAVPEPVAAPGREPQGAAPTAGAPPPVRAGDWRAAVSRARAALRAGRPVEAGEHVATARELAGETLPPIRAMDDEVETAIRAAADRWTALAPLIAAGRYRAVIPAARRLVETAADVPGPGNQLAGELLSLAEARCTAADELVARARTADAADRERLLGEVLALVTDHAEASALLAQRRPGPASTPPVQPSPVRPSPVRPSPVQPSPVQPSPSVPPVEARSSSAASPPAASPPAASPPAVPPPVGPAGAGPLVGTVAPPAAVRAHRDGRSVLVSWQPSTTAGEVRYRVIRIAADGVGRAVGVTTGSSLEDGGAPPDGAVPRYEVAAGMGGAWSVPVRTVEPGPPTGDPTSPTGVPAPAGAPGRPPVRPEATAEAAPPTRGRDEPGAGSPALAGSAADALPPPVGLRWADERLRWAWPAGCTEMMVVCRPDGPPTAADDPRAQARKVTNTRYEIDGGVPLPPGRPLYVALFCCARQAGRLVVATSAGARLQLASGGDGAGR